LFWIIYGVEIAFLLLSAFFAFAPLGWWLSRGGVTGKSVDSLALAKMKQKEDLFDFMKLQ
jgi:hypothetical protein